MGINIYAPCDKAISGMNRSFVEEFGRLKMAKWDEIHVIRTVVAVYRKCAKRARKRYYEIAFEAYILALWLCGIEGREAHEMAEKAITEKWIDRFLEEPDPVTKYRFDTETERKAYRLAEALEVSHQRNADIDKALRDWSRQTGQYAVDVTDEAVIQAYRDAGIKKVRWVSEKDDRVCGVCIEYNGNVYPIDKVPTKPHWGCRCRLVPVKD